MVDNTEKQDLVVTRVFDLPIDKVWKAWMEPELIKQWWGPDIFTCPVAKIDFRVGGTSLVCMSSPQFGDMYSTWHYLNIIPMKQIEYVHNLADKEGNKINPTSIGMPPDFPQDLRNTVIFKSNVNKTELTITEYDWPTGQMMEMSKIGLEQCLNKMEKALV